MKKTIALAFLFFLFLFILGCKKTCESSLYTKEGKCCTYVCNTDCPSGYKEGTCNCKCKSVLDESTDTNLDEVFEDNGGIEPPQLPSP